VFIPSTTVIKCSQCDSTDVAVTVIDKCYICLNCGHKEKREKDRWHRPTDGYYWEYNKPQEIRF
jgi:hypothetical protein